MATTVIHRKYTRTFRIEDADIAAAEIERILSLVDWEAKPTLFRIDTKKAYDVQQRKTIVTEQRLTLALIFHEEEILTARWILGRLAEILGEPT